MPKAPTRFFTGGGFILNKDWFYMLSTNQYKELFLYSIK